MTVSEIRVRISWGLIVAALIHAAAIAFIVAACHGPSVESSPERDWTLPPAPAQPYGGPVLGNVEKLPQPSVVNLDAQTEIKQQAPCLPCQLQPQSQSAPLYINGERVVHIGPPAVVRRPTVTPVRYPTVTPVRYPATIPASAPVATPAKKAYQVALFLDNSQQSRALYEWFTSDSDLLKLRAKSEFQVYTESNALYRSRYASVIPPSQFPVVLVQDATGGHIHAAGRNMIPGSPEELVSDISKGHDLYKQARSGNVVTGALKTRGYSWDDSINPSMQLSADDCPDGYCPTPPNNDQGWRPFDRLRPDSSDNLFDRSRDEIRDAFVWLNGSEMMTVTLAILVMGLVVYILVKKGR